MSGIQRELRAAVDAEDWGRVLRAYRRMHGVSQSYVAALCGLSQPDVSAIERGKRQVTSAEVKERIIAGLGLIGDSEIDERLERVAEGRFRLDRAVIDHFARILDQQRRLEDGIGGRPLLPIITRQLETVRGLRCAARGHLVDEVLSLASSHAQFVAWMHQDTGNSPRAVEFYSLAHDMATEAGDADMAATALSMKAHVAWSTGDALRCQRFGEAAAAVPRVSPVVEGMAVQMAARGYAMERDPQARRVLDRAFTLLASAADAPDWMYFYGEAWLTLQAGMLEAHLHNWPRAVELYRAGLDQLPEHYVRDRAWYLSCLVRAEVENDNPDAALEAARTALPLVREVNRPYGIREIERATAKLLRKRLGEARDLQALLRDAPT